MMFVMGVARTMVHWTHGWPAIADKGAESTHSTWLANNFPDRYNYNIFR